MKIEGTQDIPSELFNLYRANMAFARPNGVVQKRCAFDRPAMKTNSLKVSSAQVAQRERFLNARDLFNQQDEATRERWFDARPEWNSLLWYLNYFMMSALNGNANGSQGGVGVVKSIQVVSANIAVTGDTSISIAAVDPAKTVVFLFGNSMTYNKVHHYDGVCDDNSEQTVSLDPEIDSAKAEVKITGAGGFQDLSEGTGQGFWGNFFVTSVSDSEIKLKLQNLYSNQQYGWSLEIIEHLSQTIYPIIKAINAETIDIGWPSQPDVEALISAIVIEYI